MAKTKIEIELDFKGQNSVSQVEEKTKSLKQQLKEMKALLASGTLDNEQFRKLSIEAGNLQDRIGDVNLQVKNLASDSKQLDGYIGIARGITGGFTAVQGVMSLVGNESENLQKALLRVQGATALLSGMQEIQIALQKQSAFMMGVTDLKAKILSASTKVYTWATQNANAATNAFRIGLVGLTTAGIGVAVVMIGKYVEQLNRQKEAEEKRLQSAKEYETELTKNLAQANIEINSIKQYQAALNDSNKSLDEKKGVYKELQSLVPSLTNYTLEQATAEDVLNKAITNEIALIGLKAKATALENYVVKEEEKKLEKQQTEQANKQIANLTKINKLKADGNIVYDLGIKSVEKSLTPLEQLAKVNQDIIDLQAKQNDITQKGINLNQKKVTKGDSKEETPEERDARVKKEILAQNERDAVLEIQLEEYKYNKLANVRAVDAERISKESSQRLFNIKAYNDAVDKAEWDLVESKRAALETGFNIAQQFAGKNKTLADVLFAVQKGVAIAQIIIDLQKEVAGYAGNPTWSSAPDGGASVKIPAIAAAKIRAATSIATIAATTVGKFMNGGSAPSSGGGSASSGGVGSMGSAPNTSRFVPTTTSGGQSSQRVYVLEKDITDSQGRVAKIRHNATLI